MDKVRISDELYENIKKIAERNNKSIKEVIEEAIKAYLMGVESIDTDKPIKSVQGKIITTQFTSKCKICKSDVQAGSLVYYTRYVFNDNTARSFIICLDCYFKDTALAEWYIKKKKLQHVVKGLEKKADGLVKEIESLELQRDTLKLKKELVELIDEFKRYVLGEDIKKIDDFTSKLDQLEEKIRELEDALKTTIRKKVKVEAR